jgi:hypothetical protein
MDDIDKLLAGIERKRPIAPNPIAISQPLAQPWVTTAIDDLLASLDESVKHNVRQHLSDDRPEDQLAPAVTPEQVSQPEGQPQAKLKQQQLEQLKQQRRAELSHTAQQWLNKLPPQSEEGRWFAEFACNYASQLEAAIDYLEALQEVNDMLPKR